MPMEEYCSCGVIQVSVTPDIQIRFEMDSFIYTVFLA